MPGLFGDFDFRLLDDPEFGEDSVREELIVPLLGALGYAASPPYRIIRSRKLEHPFVYFGTVRKGITIIPDYLLERDGEYAWVLDAKAPGENIDTGKNVEQAYSYAMHRDIRVPLYGLCNGHKLVVSHVSRRDPVIDVSLQEIERTWPMVLGILGCRSAWPMGIPPGFNPDMGLALAKAGLAEDADGKKYYHVFTSVPVHYVVKIEDGSSRRVHGVGTDFRHTPGGSKGMAGVMCRCGSIQSASRSSSWRLALRQHLTASVTGCEHPALVRESGFPSPIWAPVPSRSTSREHDRAHLSRDSSDTSGA